MSDNILKFPTKRSVNNISYENSQEHLMACKEMLTEEDYRDVLCGILDSEFYNDLEPELKDIANTYLNIIIRRN